MDGSHQKLLTIPSELAESDAEDDQQVLSERLTGEAEARNQRVLIEGHKPRLMTVGIPRRYC